MKKIEARHAKIVKLKNDKAELQRMCEEAVKLVELYQVVTVSQSRQIDKLIGRTVIGRLLSVFIPRRDRVAQLQKMSDEFLKKIKEKEEALNDNASEADTGR